MNISIAMLSFMSQEENHLPDLKYPAIIGSPPTYDTILKKASLQTNKMKLQRMISTKSVEEQKEVSLLNFTDVKIQIHILNDVEQRQFSFDHLYHNKEGFIQWVNDNICNHGMVLKSLWDTMSVDLQSDDCFHGGQDICKIMAHMIQIFQRSNNWNFDIYDESSLTPLWQLEYEIAHFSVWLIRRKGDRVRGLSTPVKVGNETVNHKAYRLCISAQRFQKEIGDWLLLYSRERGKDHSSTGQAIAR